MVTEQPEIVVVTTRIPAAELSRLVREQFGDMVKYVVDVDREWIAIGGQLHADAEKVLLDRGSRQASLWGANYYPGRGRVDCVECTSLINIRPAAGNQGMEVEDAVLRERIRTLTFALIGEGEPLP